MINGFFDEYHWLSNFAVCEVTYDEITYPTTENAYQAQKSLLVGERMKFVDILPGASKRLGRRVKMRQDWDQVKLGIMKDLCKLKFEQEPFRYRLISTGTQDIVEDNNWGDVYWGVCNGVGENHLGQIIMGIRNELISSMGQ